MPRVPILAVLLLSAVLVACQSGAGGSPSATPAESAAASAEASQDAAPSATAEASEDASGAAAIEVASAAEVGDYVADAEGRTLYIFLADSPGSSSCSGECATNWPPFTVASADEATAGEGVSGELGTIQRDDGSLQVTLDGWPLYYFAGDTAAGQTTGEGVGDVWYVARPDGSTPVDEPGESVDPYFE